MNHPTPHTGRDPAFAALEQRVNNLEQQVGDWRNELSANTEATLRVECNTKELVELLKMARSGVGFFAGVGRVLRKLVIWFGPFITVVAAIYALVHGKWPGQG